MGLEIPRLDDRGFEELIEDARKRIPVHAEEWTDHNPSDPGIAILEVLAWVAESNRYRLDRVTPAHVEAYLRLLDVEPAAPTPASARLALSPPEDLAGRTVPAGERLVVEDAEGGVHTFETDRQVTLTRASVDAVVTDTRVGSTHNTTASESPGMYFHAFGEAAHEDAALYVGFDADPFAGDADYLDLAVDYHDDDLPEPADHGDESVGFEPSVETTWEYLDDATDFHDDDSWTAFGVDHDGTNDLYRGGTVRLERPGDWDDGTAAAFGEDDETRWIRCVVADDGYEVPPRLDGLSTNAVTASHRARADDETLRRVEESVEAARRRPTVQAETAEGRAGHDATTARPDQRFVLEHAPVLDAEVAVGGETWTEVPSFDASGPDDRHYVVDESRGVVRFGDEVAGRVPDPGQAVVASYVHGGGARGNVSDAADWRFAVDPFRQVGVAADDGASGGEDAETVEEALVRAERDRETPYRAVTAEDYRYVATHTPGVRFGRAKAIVGADDDVAGCETAKSVRVVAVPYSTRARPEPSDGFLRAVREHLRRHRLLTDDVTVVRPTYVGVGVDVDVGVESGYSEAGRVAAVEDALDSFLDPLEGYDGGGWPFGRPLYLSELYETVESVEGVDCVYDVAASASNAAGTDPEGNVLVDDVALLYPEVHDVSVRADRGACRRGR